MLTKAIDNVLLASYSEDIPAFLKNIYAARGISEAQLSLDLSKLLKPNFEQLDKALTLLKQALLTQKRILIVGDFDCDGATASIVAIKSLRAMGAKYVDYLVPNRFEHGYGLSAEIVKLAIKKKQPNLIITVDNGISSFDGTKLAKSSGINVIITDHHLPSNSLPEADAIINPNSKDCEFLSKNLAGVGVCFYLMSALKTYLSKCNYFIKHNIVVPDLRTVLDLVALGTVADVVKLDQNNRILVNEGVKRIRQKLCSPGILALLEIANRKAQTIQASDLGFSIAPRLNAAGRLEDISFGVQCLLTDDMNDARRYAAQLNKINEKRKLIQDDIQQQAQTIVQSQQIEAGQFAISVYDKSWHEGVVGIVAGKLKETYHCPVAVFAKSSDFLKGSIRSIADVHIKDLLDIVDRKHPNLIEKFGGHAMAAGLSIKEENFDMFKQEFANSIQAHLNNKLPKIELLTDGKLEAYDLTLTNAQLIADSGPWGQGFEEPVFYGEFELVEQKVIGAERNHLKCSLKLMNDTVVYDAIAFFQKPLNVKQILVAYKLSVNTWQGNSNLQLMISEINPP